MLLLVVVVVVHCVVGLQKKGAVGFNDFFLIVFCLSVEALSVVRVRL